MKRLIVVVLSAMLIAGLCGTVVAGSIDSPGLPSAGSGMYTLQNLYDYLTSGTALTVQTSFQEPSSGPTVGTMKSTKQIGDDMDALFNQCTATADVVMPGYTFFCTKAGSWGVQTGTYATPTPIPTPTPTITPYGIYASCKAIKAATPAAGDGTYTIDPDGPTGEAPFNSYCDMTSDGGGWTLMAAISAKDTDHFNPDHPLTLSRTWTTGDPSSDLANIGTGDFKSLAYGKITTTDLMISSANRDNTISQDLTKDYFYANGFLSTHTNLLDMIDDHTSGVGAGGDDCYEYYTATTNPGFSFSTTDWWTAVCLNNAPVIGVWCADNGADGPLMVGCNGYHDDKIDSHMLYNTVCTGWESEYDSHGDLGTRYRDGNCHLNRANNQYLIWER